MDRRTFLKTAALAALSLGEAGLRAREAKTVAAKSNAGRCDTDGMLIVNGAREFIQGLYFLPNLPNPFEETRNAGFNLVHLSPTNTEFAKAREHGLYAWTSLGSISPSNRTEAESRIRKTVMTLKDEPALLFWETEDEPTFGWKKPRRGCRPPTSSKPVTSSNTSIPVIHST